MACFSLQTELDKKITFKRKISASHVFLENHNVLAHFFYMVSQVY